MTPPAPRVVTCMVCAAIPLRGAMVLRALVTAAPFHTSSLHALECRLKLLSNPGSDNMSVPLTAAAMQDGGDPTGGVRGSVVSLLGMTSRHGTAVVQAPA